ncbi:MAG: esterase/lipase family protein [Nitrospiraceae bacterium]
MTKRPLLLVLAHGIFGWGDQAAGRDMRQDYYTGLRPFLEHRYGNREDLALRIIAPQVPVSERAAVRGEHLRDAIQAQLAGMPSETRVHIIAHSMGGLDGRWVIAEGSVTDRIDSLTTIATPHRGTSLGDIAYALRAVIPPVADGFYQLDYALQEIENKFHDFFGWLAGPRIPITRKHFECIRHLLGNLVDHTSRSELERGLRDLTLDGVQQFNADLSEAERRARSGAGRPIRYVAYGGALPAGSESALKPSSELIRVFGTQLERAGSNDGAVSDWSSHFPWDDDGREYAETIPYDHFGQINWRIPDFRWNDDMEPALKAIYQSIMDRIVGMRA